MFSKNARLINNKKLKKNARLRAKVLTLIRQFFNDEGLLEVDTPLIELCPSMEPAISSFTTDYLGATQKRQLYLQSSPEYAMKKLLASGFENIFQITKSFRNGEITRLHNPEFTILEWYRTDCDYQVIMNDVEKLLTFIREGLQLGEEIKYLNKKVDLSPPFGKLYIKDAFKLFAGIDLDEIRNEDYHSILRNRGLSIDSSESDFNTFFYYIFVNDVEPRLGADKPQFLVDFPAQLGSLARNKPGDDTYVERFELYIHGLELCNAFSELNDHDEQKRRFALEKRKRVDSGLPDYPIDTDFLAFLKHGMPPAAGIAFGIDRLLMLFADTDDINDVILFPFGMMADFNENV